MKDKDFNKIDDFIDKIGIDGTNNDIQDNNKDTAAPKTSKGTEKKVNNQYQHYKNNYETYNRSARKQYQISDNKYQKAI